MSYSEKKLTAVVWPVQNDSYCSLPQLFSLAPCLLLPALPFSPSPCLSSPDWCQLMSEPAYGFVLFDYITGNLEGQTDRNQLL